MCYTTDPSAQSIVFVNVPSETQILLPGFLLCLLQQLPDEVQDPPYAKCPQEEKMLPDTLEQSVTVGLFHRVTHILYRAGSRSI